MKKLLGAIFLLANIFSLSATDWGQTGHRVIGEVAQQYLTPKTAQTIAKLLDGASLAFVSTFADEIRSDSRYQSYAPWHYLNMPLDKIYGEVTPNPKGDVVQAINTCIQVLQDPNAAKDDKAFHLRLLVHFVGDLHQPMHVGRAEDRGGNDITVYWFGKKTNLHRLWDSQLIDHYQMSYTELAQNLPPYETEQHKKIVQAPLLDWVAESQDHAKNIYAQTQPEEKLGYKYHYEYFGVVRNRLHKAGLRLAAVLNQLFDPQA